MAKKTKDADSAPSYEQLLDTIEKRLETLESGELSLDLSLKAYEEGVNALRSCYSLLKQAEGKIEMLTKTIGEPELAAYDAEAGQASRAVNDQEGGKRLF